MKMKVPGRTCYLGLAKSHISNAARNGQCAKPRWLLKQTEVLILDCPDRKDLRCIYACCDDTKADLGILGHPLRLLVGDLGHVGGESALRAGRCSTEGHDERALAASRAIGAASSDASTTASGTSVAGVIGGSHLSQPWSPAHRKPCPRESNVWRRIPAAVRLEQKNRAC